MLIRFSLDASLILKGRCLYLSGKYLSPLIPRSTIGCETSDRGSCAVATMSDWVLSLDYARFRIRMCRDAGESVSMAAAIRYSTRSHCSNSWELPQKFDSSRLLTDLAEGVERMSRPDALELGLGPVLQAMTALRIMERPWQNALQAKSALHFLFAFIVSGLQTTKVSEAAEQFRSIWPRAERVLDGYAYCDELFAERLVSNVDMAVSRILPFGALLHVYEWIRTDQGAVDSLDIRQWLTFGGLKDATEKGRGSNASRMFRDAADALAGCLPRAYLKNIGGGSGCRRGGGSRDSSRSSTRSVLGFSGTA